MFGTIIKSLALMLLGSGFFISAHAAKLYELNAKPDGLEFKFDQNTSLLGSRYLDAGNTLVVDFSKFTSTIDYALIRHRLVREIKTFQAKSLTRLQFSFIKGITYRIENRGKNFFLKIRAENISETPASGNGGDLPLRTALKDLARQSGIDIVISHAVQGEASMAIRNTTDPKNALLALIAANGLQYRKLDKVWMVEPRPVKPAVSEPKKTKTKAEPKLVTAIIPLKYAKAGKLALTLKSGSHNLLSSKGSISADERTNSLLISDTLRKIGEIKNLVKKLDKPRKQVLIKSKIVIATDEFGKSLGVRFGLSHHGVSNDNIHSGISGSSASAQNTINAAEPYKIQGFNVNLPVGNSYGGIGLMVAKLPFGTLLDLELTASQLEGNINIVASPSVMTADGAVAHIKQGVQVPYRTTTDNIVDVKFKDALMELKVVPQITPDGYIIMELAIKKDAVGAILCNNCEPSIDTREVKTRVSVKNGETLVIGGIKEESRSSRKDSVPGISRIPVIGKLFSRKTRKLEKRELFIFITPSIIQG